MEPFKYIQAQNERAAVQAMASGDNSKFIAGGTNLVDLMKLYIETPRQIVDINGLKLNTIESIPNGGVRIGALVRNSDLAYDSTISKRYPVLSEALLSGASAQLRNMATTGGNLMQRVRCPYFYDKAFACNKRDPGSGCSALKGFNRMHAVLGTSDYCIAAHPSDMCVALSALDATIHVQGPNGERTIPMTGFHLLPGNTPEKETALEKGELITAVDLPEVPVSARSLYLKVRDRASYDFALASAAVVLDVSNGTIRSARIALGGVGTKPWRSAEAEKVLTGARASGQTYQSAAEAALKDAKPYKYNSFKIELAKRTLTRALATVGGMS